ncbi:MAG: NAD-dependent epimerase/dehydratase family protein, partial [Solirubrobacterales bacterium]|nr:NAD-dependent epimerase/dehydratase family protein [Solirubrobacterales bacterium]
LGTAHAIDAAERGGAERFVQFSSVTVFGMRFPDQVDERYPVHPSGIPYPDTKIASEQLVLQAHLEGRVPVSVVRPGDVYGPRSRAWALQPVELMKARRWLLPDGGRGIFSPVYVDDLVAGVVAVAGAQEASGQVLTLSGGIGVANREFFGHYSAALGRRMPTLPAALARRAAGLAEVLDRSGTGDVNPRSVDYLLRTGTYSIAKAERLVGWRPQVGLAEGMERTLAWLRDEGLLTR